MDNSRTIQPSTIEKIKTVDEVLEPVLNPPPSIEIDNVTVSFKTSSGTYTAVKEISLTVKKGEIVSLIGHSGCGKSTLMGTISGMVKPSAGTVKANGMLVTKPGPDRGIVFQNYSLLPWLSVYRNIYEAVDAALKDKPSSFMHELVERNLKMVNLWSHKGEWPGHS